MQQVKCGKYTRPNARTHTRTLYSMTRTVRRRHPSIVPERLHREGVNVSLLRATFESGARVCLCAGSKGGLSSCLACQISTRFHLLYNLEGCRRRRPYVRTLIRLLGDGRHHAPQQLLTSPWRPCWMAHKRFFFYEQVLLEQPAQLCCALTICPRIHLVRTRKMAH